MKESEMNDRRAGFAAAVGLLLKHADSTVRDGILETLKSLGDDLNSQIGSDEHAQAALDLGFDPCPPGLCWDPRAKMCVDC